MHVLGEDWIIVTRIFEAPDSNRFLKIHQKKKEKRLLLSNITRVEKVNSFLHFDAGIQCAIADQRPEKKTKLKKEQKKNKNLKAKFAQ